MGVDKEVKSGISFNVLKYRKQRNRKSQSWDMSRIIGDGSLLWCILIKYSLLIHATFIVGKNYVFKTHFVDNVA